MTVAHLEAVAPERCELVGCVVPRDREMLGRGSEVLADGQDVHVLGAQVPHRHQQLVPLLPQPAHDPRLRERAGIHRFGPSQELERARIPTARPRQPVQSLDGLEVVVQRSEEHTSELQSPCNLVCRLLLEKKKMTKIEHVTGSPSTSTTRRLHTASPSIYPPHRHLATSYVRILTARAHKPHGNVVPCSHA